MNRLNKTKIPTLLAIFFLISGLVMAIFLNESRRYQPAQASSDSTPTNIIISNVSASSATISWSTNEQTSGYVKWGSSNSAIYLTNTKESEFFSSIIHTLTLNNLRANTEYFFLINSNGSLFYNSGTPWIFKTASVSPAKPFPNIIYGQVADVSTDNKIILFASTAGGNILSSTINRNGSWLIDLSNFLSSDLKSYLPINDSTLIEISVLSNNGKSSYTVTHPKYAKPLPAIYLGRAYDIRSPQPSINIESPEVF